MLWDVLGSLSYVFLLVGRGSEIYRAQGNVVADFFRRQQAMEEFDLYAFDESFSWCLVSTHELVPDPKDDADFLVIANGCMPRSQA